MSLSGGEHSFLGEAVPQPAFCSDVPGLTWKQSRAKRQAWRGFLHPKESHSMKNRIFALVSTGVSMLGIVAAQTTIYLPGQGRGATASQLLDLRVSKVAAGQLLIGASRLLKKGISMPETA